ncbi:MAG: glycosyltransferase, partial [Patescibacteria group bacterium]
MIPGTTASLQKEYPNRIVLYSPEFLSETTAAYDARNPFSNIVGVPENSERHLKAAEAVHAILPPAPFSQTCTSTEAEIIKYTHNASGYTQILLFNLMYDLTRASGCDWSVIHKAVLADPLICNRYAQPVHKSGRGAGGHCFIKDFSALKGAYRDTVRDDVGVSLMSAMEEKNMQLLLSTGKDVDLLAGVYGRDILDKIRKVAVEQLRPTPARDVRLLICTQAVDKGDPILGFFHQWVAEFALHAREVYAICLQRGERSLPSNVREFTLGKEIAQGPRILKRVRYILRFWRYLWQLRGRYDTVLVHINAEYVILAGLFWRLGGKKIALIANDAGMLWRTHLAARISHVVFHTDPNAYVARFPNAALIHVGVESDIFSRQPRTAARETLLFLGRIAPAKRLDAVISAVDRISRTRKNVRLDIYGATAIREDEVYTQELRKRFSSLEKSGVISYRGAVVHEKTPPVYAAHDIFVNAGSASGFNKAVYEAMAAGCLVVTSNSELHEVVHPDLFARGGGEEEFRFHKHANCLLALPALFPPLHQRVPSQSVPRAGPRPEEIVLDS